MKISSLDLNSAKKLLPERQADGNKGTFGKVLIIAGSKNMVGCCTLACKGALRSGAGLVKIIFPDVLYPALTSNLSEPLFHPVETDNHGFISHLAVADVLEEASKADAVLLGCGIGCGYAQSLIVTSLIELCDKPLILDADALNNLAPCVNILHKRKGEILLTPHPGEMSRLMGCSISDIEADRQGSLHKFTEKYNVNVLLKGHRTLIENRAGDRLFVNETGNTGLSKGGSGDLLSGIITGLVPAFKGDLFKAGILGAFIHGKTSEVLKTEMSEYSILPTDCADVLGKVFKLIETSGID